MTEYRYTKPNRLIGSPFSVLRSPSSGSTLIDVLFGTVVIGIVVTSLYLAFALANRIALRAKHVAVAKGVAESEIETARRSGYGTLAIGSTTTAAPALPSGQKLVEVIYYDPPTNRVKQITVTVTWQERDSTESFVLTTLATQGGGRP